MDFAYLPKEQIIFSDYLPDGAAGLRLVFDFRLEASDLL